MTASTTTVWTAAGMNIAASAIIAGFTLLSFSGQNELFTQQGRQSAQLGQLIESTTAMQSAIAAVNQRFDTVDDRFDRIDVMISRVDRKIELSTASVRKLIQNANIPITKDVEFVSIGNQIVALPETFEARLELINRKLLSIDVTPSVQGFVVDETSAAIVRQVIENSDAALDYLTVPYEGLSKQN